jgi:hypothetical protein
MPQLCTVCSHPKHKKINVAIVKHEQSNRAIASQYGLDRRAIDRHEKEHLPEVLLKVMEGEKREEADEVMREVRKCCAMANKLLDACDDWLSDPDNPDKHTLDPRADEVSVIYSELNDDGKLHRKRAPLSELLAKLEAEPGRMVEAVEIKRADPRELILKAIAQLRPVAELLARLEGRLKGDASNGDGQLPTMAQINILAQIYQTTIIKQGQ